MQRKGAFLPRSVNNLQRTRKFSVLRLVAHWAFSFSFFFGHPELLHCRFKGQNANKSIYLSNLSIMHDPTAPPVATGSCNLVNTLLLIATMTQTLQVFLSPLSETSTPVTLLSHQRKQCVTKNAAVKKLG